MNDSLGGKLPYLVGAVAGAFLSLPMAIQTVVALMIVDLLSGLLAGVYAKSVSSERMRKGLARKAMALLVIGASALLARGMGGLYEFDASSVVTAVAGAYGIYEFVSILENASRIGLPVPQWLLDKLAVIRKEFPLAPAKAPAEEPGQ